MKAHPAQDGLFLCAESRNANQHSLVDRMDAEPLRLSRKCGKVIVLEGTVGVLRVELL